MSRQPEVLWAQRSEKVYLTISVPDSEDVVVKTEPQGVFGFSAISHGESFSFTLELFDSVLPEGSKTKTKVGSRNIICSIQKDKKCWWKRLLKSEEKHPYIKVDWNKWHDEDEESETSVGSDNDFDDGENDESDGDDGLLCSIRWNQRLSSCVRIPDTSAASRAPSADQPPGRHPSARPAARPPPRTPTSRPAATPSASRHRAAAGQRLPEHLWHALRPRRRPTSGRDVEAIK